MQHLQSPYLQSKGPLCQSCGMPLSKPNDFGTDAEGLRVNDYCNFCFQNGAFTEPAITLQEMIDRCVAIVVQQGIMAKAQAKEVMTQMLPKLKRWRTE